MTTKAAEALYLAEHLNKWKGKEWNVYNPKNKSILDLPIIYGFNNGGGYRFYAAQLIAEDGTALGSHACSNEGYMEHDLGIVGDYRQDRHLDFKNHYPDGYKMAFVSLADVDSHEGLKLALKKNEQKGLDEKSKDWMKKLDPIHKSGGE